MASVPVHIFLRIFSALGKRNQNPVLLTLWTEHFGSETPKHFWRCPRCKRQFLMEDDLKPQSCPYCGQEHLRISRHPLDPANKDFKGKSNPSCQNLWENRWRRYKNRVIHSCVTCGAKFSGIKRGKFFWCPVCGKRIRKQSKRKGRKNTKRTTKRSPDTTSRERSLFLTG